MSRKIKVFYVSIGVLTMIFGLSLIKLWKVSLFSGNSWTIKSRRMSHVQPGNTRRTHKSVSEVSEQSDSPMNGLSQKEYVDLPISPSIASRAEQIWSRKGKNGFSKPSNVSSLSIFVSKFPAEIVPLFLRVHC